MQYQFKITNRVSWAVPVFTAHTFPRTESPGRRNNSKQVPEAWANLPKENKGSPSLTQELYQEPAPLPLHLYPEGLQGDLLAIWPHAVTSPHYSWISPFTGKCTWWESVTISFISWGPCSPFQTDEPISPTKCKWVAGHNSSEPGRKGQK